MSSQPSAPFSAFLLQALLLLLLKGTELFLVPLLEPSDSEAGTLEHRAVFRSVRSPVFPWNPYQAGSCGVL